MPKKGKVSIKANQLIVSTAKKSPQKGRQTSNSTSMMQYSKARPMMGTKSISFSHGSDSSTLVVSGKEVFTPVTTSQTWKTLQFVINPSNILMFPKLQGIATNFEEFYVRSLNIRYITACPTTRSGSVSLMVDYDPTDNAPKNVLEVMANASSVTGSVGENLSLNFIPSSQGRRWYYTRASQYTSYSSEVIRQISPAQIFVCTTNSASADVGLIAGYLEVSYSIEFKDMRPPPEVFGGFTSPVVGGSAQSAGSYVNMDLLIENALGINGWTNNSNLNPVPGNTSINNKNSFILSAGRYLISALWDWLAVGASQENRATDSSVPYVLVKEPDTPRYIEEKKSDPLAIPQLKRQVAYSEPSTYGVQYTRVRQLPDGSFEGQPFGSTSWEPVPPFEERPRTALAAGDCSMYVNAYDLDTGVSSGIISSTVSTGTGAVHLDRSLELLILKPTVIAPVFNNVESRKLNAFDLNFAQISAPE